MSSNNKDTKPTNQLTFFEKQRDLLISEITVSMDSVLTNLNALNRSMEGTIAVGKEFDSVASLWSSFYDGLSQVEQLRQQQTEQPSQEKQNEQSDHINESNEVSAKEQVSLQEVEPTGERESKRGEELQTE
ncbi:hypothetical protein WICMUC_002885 [Wickerhamomyces mucosus]|uniref:DASH complex subunit DAD1 n=1 Tax=Wickerhamomyces mucosus TaxID=1378264 RepID=A0A9P8PMV7_9ASCO|nr:hypothetical protein WICMUC_002885 [Wickerhamomyces mucosus]